jgi:hypothetical protein
MSSFEQEINEREARELESLIFAARNYVAPSGDLRSAVVEDAKLREQTRRVAKRFGWLALACMLVWSVSMPVVRGLSVLRESIKAPRSSEVQARAAEQAEATKSDSAWSLVDTFSDTRSIILNAGP